MAVALSSVDSIEHGAELAVEVPVWLERRLAVVGVQRKVHVQLRGPVDRHLHDMPHRPVAVREARDDIVLAGVDVGHDETRSAADTPLEADEAIGRLGDDANVERVVQRLAPGVAEPDLQLAHGFSWVLELRAIAAHTRRGGHEEARHRVFRNSISASRSAAGRSRPYTCPVLALPRRAVSNLAPAFSASGPSTMKPTRVQS